MIGRRFLFNCLAKEECTIICGDANRARLIFGIIWVVRGKCLILKNVLCDISRVPFGVVCILAISTLRSGTLWKYLDKSNFSEPFSNNWNQN
jgi:hypothetical protein